jgi:hypothetical protein
LVQQVKARVEPRGVRDTDPRLRRTCGARGCRDHRRDGAAQKKGTSADLALRYTRSFRASHQTHPADPARAESAPPADDPFASLRSSTGSPRDARLPCARLESHDQQHLNDRTDRRRPDNSQQSGDQHSSYGVEHGANRQSLSVRLGTRASRVSSERGCRGKEVGAVLERSRSGRWRVTVARRARRKSSRAGGFYTRFALS